MDFDDYDIPAASEEEQQQQLPPPVPDYASFEDQGAFSTEEEALVVPPSHEISEVYNMPEPEPVGEDALS